MLLLPILGFIATLFAAWRAWRRLRFFLHIMQLEGYKIDEYTRWLADRPFDAVVRRSHLIGLGILSLSVYLVTLTAPFWPVAAVLLLWPVVFASSRRYRFDLQKKPIAFTPRMKRLLGTSVFLALVPVLSGALAGLLAHDARGYLILLGGLLTADLLGPVWVIIASLIMKPVEFIVQSEFKRKARQRVAAQPDLKVIGITGSYGKTSVKFITAAILGQRFNVLATPGSYNTPMGICLVVNRDLRREHQVLILEMGVRKQGDIRELCDIVTPDLAVVTTVGVAHLETMKSIENIATEKSEILALTRHGGDVILNADDPRVAAMAPRATGRVWRVSAAGIDGAEITARDITYGPEGAHFRVRDDRGNEAEVKTRLLGHHNVINILLAIATARSMGMRLRQMIPAIARLEPVEHRLQLRREGAITIIDDAFNSNPVGAKNAVEILGQFRTGRRIIVTPGMIELGPRQWEENHRFGEHIAKNVDLALLVGAEQTRPILEGIMAAGFSEESLMVMTSLFAAQEFLKTYLEPGDVVLYENDLPDHFNEK